MQAPDQKGKGGAKRKAVRRDADKFAVTGNVKNSTRYRQTMTESANIPLEDLHSPDTAVSY